MLVGRELNPYFAEGGSGMPAPAGDKQAAAGGVVGGGDGGVAWLTKVTSPRLDIEEFRTNLSKY